MEVIGDDDDNESLEIFTGKIFDNDNDALKRTTVMHYKEVWCPQRGIIEI